MGEGADYFDTLHLLYFFRKSSRFFNFYTNPVHACFQGKMDFSFFTTPQPCFIKQVQAFFIKHCMGDVKSHTNICHRRADRHSPQHKDRFGNTCFPQLYSFLYQRHRKIIHTGLHAGYGHRDCTMAVRVGLHYRAQLRIRFQIFPGGFNIICYGVQIYFRPCPPVRYHEYSPPSIKKTRINRRLLKYYLKHIRIIAHFTEIR